MTQGANTTENYSYDPVGNRLSSLGLTPYNYNTSNELTSTPSTSYTYDSNGNVTGETNSSGTTTYAWDFENRLTSVTLPGTGGTVTFKYDPFGRRVYKSSSSGTTIYAYDGDNVIETTNQTGGILARFAQGQNIDEPLAESNTTGTSFYEADGLGSITSLTNGSGSLAQTYTYDSFGNVTHSTGSLANPFQYTARDFDSETGLYYYRARYYDPTTGRFLSEDPAGFYGGFDLYNYVKNDPIDFADPSGLKCEQVSPWTEVPSMSAPGWNPPPYLTLTEGQNWIKTGWNFVSLGPITDYTHCICFWIARETRVRRFYKVPVTEVAEFKCDCRTEYRTRKRTKYYSIDGPGTPYEPPKYGMSWGTTIQDGAMAGSNPRNKNNDVCQCQPPTP